MGWTQADFAEKLGIDHANNVSACLENPEYGKHTLSTLKNIAATCDVGLVVWFVPFSRLVDWVTETPYEDKGLSPGFYDIPPFDKDAGISAVEINKKLPASIAEAGERRNGRSKYASKRR